MMKLEREPWFKDAFCRGDSVAKGNFEDFFPSTQSNEIPGRELCIQCSVKNECLDYALRCSLVIGCFGGLSPKERRAAKKRFSIENKQVIADIEATFDDIVESLYGSEENSMHFMPTVLYPARNPVSDLFG